MERLIKSMNLLIVMACFVAGEQSNLSPIWPKVNDIKMSNSTNYYTLTTSTRFETKSSNKRLQRGIERTKKHIRSTKWSNIVPTYQYKENLGKMSASNSQSIYSVKVNVKDSVNESLSLETDESYELTVQQITNSKKGEVIINANTIYGALHGLKTLTQLVQFNTVNKIHYLMNAPINIKDNPKFQHRGLLLDTTRSFFSTKAIKRTISGLSLNKMNVLHWHIIGAHSFPYVSTNFPNLSKNGANFNNQVYSQQEIKDIVEYGLDYGVRVIPELQVPNQAHSIGQTYPELTTCMDEKDWDKVSSEPPSGQLDPTNPKSLDLVKKLVDEFSSIFKDGYIHFSGDSINLNCWNSSEKIQAYLKSNPNKKLEDLLGDFMNQVYQHSNDKKKSIMIWDDILLKNNLTVSSDTTLIQIAQGPETIKKVADNGYKAVLSNPKYWSLDCGKGRYIGDAPSSTQSCGGFKNWQIIYTYNLFANLSKSQQSMIKGGEITMLSGKTDELSLDSMLWPRVASAAEVLWSGNLDEMTGKVIGTKDAVPRLNNMRYRMVDLGFNAESIQPLWCVVNPGKCDTTDNMTSLREPFVMN